MACGRRTVCDEHSVENGPKTSLKTLRMPLGFQYLHLSVCEIGGILEGDCQLLCGEAMLSSSYPSIYDEHENAYGEQDDEGDKLDHGPVDDDEPHHRCSKARTEHVSRWITENPHPFFLP